MDEHWTKKYIRGFPDTRPDLMGAHLGFQLWYGALEGTTSCPSLVSTDTGEMGCRPHVAGIGSHGPPSHLSFLPHAGCLNPVCLNPLCLSAHPASHLPHDAHSQQQLVLLHLSYYFSFHTKASSASLHNTSVHVGKMVALWLNKFITGTLPVD